MPRYISSTPVLRWRIRSCFNGLIILPLEKICNSSIRFNSTETIPQFSVDDFLLNETLSGANKSRYSDRTNLVSFETFILQFDSKTKIKTIEKYVTQLIQDKDFKKVWKIANSMKKHHIFPSNKLYILLLQVCYLTNKSEATSLAVKLYYEAMTLHSTKRGEQRITQDVHNSLAYFLLVSFQSCHDFTELINLKMFWEKYIIYNADKPVYELLYHSAYINTLLNTSQNQIAIEHFEKAFQELTHEDQNENYHQFNRYDVLRTLPTIRILDAMSSNKDCYRLQKWLQITNYEEHITFNNEEDYSKRILNNNNWLKYLNISLLNNNYELVKCIYDNFIMRGFHEGISTEDILFRKDYTSLTGNVVLDSINDETIFQILHTFAINGDVNLTLSLIESHYIHKTMRGEKALTKELCLKIIESYCYHPDLQNNWSEDEIMKSVDYNDESIKRVLDVLNGFVIKFNKNRNNQISYRDITDAMSFKFVNYKVYDANIRQAKNKQFEISEKIKNPEDIDKIPGLPRKISNTNIENSQHGNVLANLETLSSFISSHLIYLFREKNYSNSTITLFINCILNHTNLYQNFSGTVKALSVIFKVNSNMVKDFLNDDLFNIILNSLANSNSGKISSLLLFNHLHSKQNLTHDHYRCFISATLRGDFHESLQFLLYNYLIDYGGIIDPKINQMLLDLPSNIKDSCAGTSSLLSFIEDNMKSKLNLQAPLDHKLTSDKINEFWRTKKLCREEPHISDQNLTGFKRMYNPSFDLRDARYLSYMFEIPIHKDVQISIKS